MNQRFIDPSEALKQLTLREDMVACDFGSGSGGWVLPLAKILETGEVFAVDILDEPLSALRAKAELAKLENIKTIKADIEKGTGLFADSCDLVLMTNLLFECEDKKNVLAEGKRVLKKGGKILIVDWKAEAALGPKQNRVNLPELKETCLDLNLRIEKEFLVGPYHFGLILVK